MRPVYRSPRHGVAFEPPRRAGGAPGGGSRRAWPFLVGGEPAVKGRLGPLYREAMARLWAGPYAARVAAAAAAPDDPESVQFLAVQRSANWLAVHFEEVPLFLFPFARPEAGATLY